MRPYMSPDGSALFFCSDRRGTQDIWWVDAAVIDPLRESVFKEIEKSIKGGNK